MNEQPKPVPRYHRVATGFLAGYIGSLVGFFTLATSLTFYERTSFCFLHAFVVGVFCALLIYVPTLQSSDRRRRSEDQRSPWGELRTSEPRPFQERMQQFVSATPHEEPEPIADDFVSRMPFWCAFELPTDVTIPKPIWIIRRLLMRIREAVRPA